MPTRSVELVKHPMRVRTLEVRAVRRTGPLYQLITLGGDELADFRTLSPTDHVGLVPPSEAGLEQHGLPQEQVKVTGYWRRDEPDIDYDAPLAG